MRSDAAKEVRENPERYRLTKENVRAEATKIASAGKVAGSRAVMALATAVGVEIRILRREEAGWRVFSAKPAQGRAKKARKTTTVVWLRLESKHYQWLKPKEAGGNPPVGTMEEVSLDLVPDLVGEGRSASVAGSARSGSGGSLRRALGLGSQASGSSAVGLRSALGLPGSSVSSRVSPRGASVGRRSVVSQGGSQATRVGVGSARARAKAKAGSRNSQDPAKEATKALGKEVEKGEAGRYTAGDLYACPCGWHPVKGLRKAGKVVQADSQAKQHWRQCQGTLPPKQFRGLRAHIAKTAVAPVSAEANRRKAVGDFKAWTAELARKRVWRLLSFCAPCTLTMPQWSKTGEAAGLSCMCVSGAGFPPTWPSTREDRARRDPRMDLG